MEPQIQNRSPFPLFKVLPFLLIAIAIPITIYVGKQTQNTKQEAAINTDTTNPTPPDTIDVLDYFLTKHPDRGLTGSHPLSQTIDTQKAYYTKWQRDGDPSGLSSVFEIYTWDDTNVYLKEDHSGAPVDFYTFNPGTWMKRHMRVGESILTDTNQIQVYNTNCQPVASSSDNTSLRTGTFPIELTLERQDTNFAVGGQLGTQDVIVLRYDSSVGNPNGIFERLYYSKEWGLILWEQYSKATQAITASSFFNVIETHHLTPDIAKACSRGLQSPTPSATAVPTTPTPTGSTTPERPGDANGDGIVNGLDYNRWLAEKRNPPQVLRADFNHDGEITGADYTLWQTNRT